MSTLPPMRPIWQDSSELSHIRHTRSLSSSLQNSQIRNSKYQNETNSTAHSIREARLLRQQTPRNSEQYSHRNESLHYNRGNNYNNKNNVNQGIKLNNYREEWEQENWEESEEEQEEQENERIRVVLRIRPPLQRELKYYNTTHGGPFVSLVSVVNNTTIALREHVTMPHGEQVLCSQQRFSFDRVFSANSSQDVVYSECAREAVHSVLHGYNATLLAYGQTGTGKTYTMEGFPQHETRGIIPHAVEDIFDCIAQHKRRKYTRKPTQSFHQNQSCHYNNHDDDDQEEEEEYTIKASYLQIYNEVISDLLILPSHLPSSTSPQHNMPYATSSLSSSTTITNSTVNSITNYLSGKTNAKEHSTPRLSIRESPEHGIYVDGLTVWKVTNPEDVYMLLERGTALRTTASTRMSELSSRSHAIFTLIVTKKEINHDKINTSFVEREHIGKLNIVDLAGSEKIKQSGSSGIRLEEAKCINKSLHALGNVIAALAKRSAQTNPGQHLSTGTLTNSKNKNRKMNTRINNAHAKNTKHDGSFLESSSSSFAHSLSGSSSTSSFSYSSSLNMLQEEEQYNKKEDSQLLFSSSSSFMSSQAPSSFMKKKMPHSNKHKDHVKMQTTLLHIPFRNSVLTNLLRDSLGGNCRTTLIACISPSLDSYTETLMTLQFASRAKHIHTYSKVNLTSFHDNNNNNAMMVGGIVNTAAIDKLIQARTHELITSYEDKISALQSELQQFKAIQWSEHNEEFTNYINNNNEFNKPLNREEEALHQEMHKRQLLEQRVHELEHTLQLSLTNERYPQEHKYSSVNGNSSHMNSDDVQYSAKEYSRLIEELEVERASLMEHSSHIDTYKDLLLKQREMMVRLNQRLTERDEVILHLHDEVEAYDIHVQELERQLMTFKKIISENNSIMKNELNNERSDVVGSNEENINHQKKNRDVDSINNNSASTSLPKSCCHSWEQILNNADQIVKQEFNSNVHSLHSALQLTECKQKEAESVISILYDVIAKINGTLCGWSSNMIIESSSNNNNKKDEAFLEKFTQSVMTRIEKTHNTTQETFAQLQSKLVQERTARIRALRMCNELQGQIQILAQEHKLNSSSSPLLEQLHSCWNEIEREMITRVNNKRNELSSTTSSSPIFILQKENEQENWLKETDRNNSNNYNNIGGNKKNKTVDTLTELVKSQEATIVLLQNKLKCTQAQLFNCNTTTNNHVDTITNTKKVEMNVRKTEKEESEELLQQQEQEEEKSLVHHTMKLINDSLTLEIHDLKNKLSQHVKDRHALQMIMEQRVKTKIDNICEILESLQKTLVDRDNQTTSISSDEEKNVHDKLYKVKSQAQSLRKLVSAAITAMKDLSAIE